MSTLYISRTFHFHRSFYPEDIYANRSCRIAEAAYTRWSAFQSDPAKSPIAADLRAPVYRAAILKNPAAAVLGLKNEWFTTPAIDGKEICLQALGHTPDESLIKNVILPFLFNTSPPASAADAVPAGDIHILAGVLGANRVARPLLWAYLRDHWDALVSVGGGSKLAGNPILIDRLVKVSLPFFSDLDTLAEIDGFFARVDTKGFDRTLEQVKDTIRARAAYKMRDSEGVKGWLVANGYA